MAAKQSRTHFVTVTLRFDAPVTSGQARLAAWDWLDGFEGYGNGKPEKGDASPNEAPYGRMIVRVRKR